MASVDDGTSGSTAYRTKRCIYAISDLHVDYEDNLRYVEGWSDTRYQDDVLLLAGDVTDNLTLLQYTLKVVRNKFSTVFFVPGNHELWIRPHEKMIDSIDKFHQILALCNTLGVYTTPKKITINPDNNENVWIVPMFSWYSVPECDPEHSLYKSYQNSYRCNKNLTSKQHSTVHSNSNTICTSKGNKRSEHLNSNTKTTHVCNAEMKAGKSNTNNSSSSQRLMWMDVQMCRWSTRNRRKYQYTTPSQYFTSLNQRVFSERRLQVNDNHKYHASDTCHHSDTYHQSDAKHQFDAKHQSDVHHQAALYDAPVISFTHMVPRQDLLAPDAQDKCQVAKEMLHRGKRIVPQPSNVHRPQSGDAPSPSPSAAGGGFNFSAYAGCTRIEEQIRQIGSTVHVYGHQHRNRDRTIDGVRYVSHCLGSVAEQKQGWMWGLRQWRGPKLVWPHDSHTARYK